MMKNLKALMRGLIKSMDKSTRRFPETLVMAAGFVVVGIMLNRMEYDAGPAYLLRQATLNRWLITFILGAPLFALGKLILERLGISLKKRLLVDGVIGAFLIFFHQMVPEELYQEFMFKYLLLNLATYLGFLMAPYFYKRENFSRYSLKILTQFFITVFFSAVLYGGLNGIIFTLDQLFELNLNYKIYLDVYLITVGFFAVPHFLGNLNGIHEDVDPEYFPQVWAILFSYIVVPLLSIYTGILYAYFIRLVLLREFPINILTHLVVWYGIISVVVLFFIEKLQDRNDYLRRFYRIFPKVILLPLAMLFTAIFSRIADYGVTPARYFVVVTGTWILLSMLYVGFVRRTRYTFVVLGAMVVILLAAYGPVSAFNLSFNNQLQRFEALLEATDMLAEGEIQRNPDLPLEDQMEINEFLRYFNNNHDQRTLYFLPGEFYLYEDTEEVFGFPYEYYYPGRFEEDEIIEYYTFDRFDLVIPVSESDYFAELNIEFSQNMTVSGEEVTFEFDSETLDLSLLNNGNLLGAVNMVDFVLDFDESRGGTPPDTMEEAMVTYDFPEARMVFFIKNIFYNPDDVDGMKYGGHFNGLVFIEFK